MSPLRRIQRIYDQCNCRQCHRLSFLLDEKREAVTLSVQLYSPQHPGWMAMLCCSIASCESAIESFAGHFSFEFEFENFVQLKLIVFL